MSYTPKGETVNWGNVELVLAGERIVNRAFEKANTRYQALLEASSEYQAFLAEAGQARASVRKYRQLGEEFIQKAIHYKKLLDEGQDAPEGVDYRTEVEVALANAQFFREMAETEEGKTCASPELAVELRKMWEKAMNSAAGQLGYNTWENVQKEAAAIEGEIMGEIHQRLDAETKGIADEKAAEERRIAIESNKSYLDSVRNSAESLLRLLFGEEQAYVGNPEVLHVDGALNYEMPATIFTDDSTTVARLQQELQTPEGVLTLASKESIPLDNGTSMVQVIYRGLKPLH